MNPLSNFKKSLETAVETRNKDFLLEVLSRKHLPVLGGNEQPADIVLRALSTSGFDSKLGEGLTILLISLIDRYFMKSYPDKKTTDLNYVYNLFLFASYLPRNSFLFESLKNCFQSNSIRKDDMIGRQLTQAITYQQTDASLENIWMKYIEGDPSFCSPPKQLNLQRRAEVLEAWQGLLYIPPTEEECKAGQVISTYRINKGLEVLDKAVLDLGNTDVLKYAVRLLKDSYPRSTEFWTEVFSKNIQDYSESLRKMLAE